MIKRVPPPVWPMVVAILVLAFNLRVSVNALGAVLPQVRADLGLSGTVAGLLNALPPLVFALAGLAVPTLADRIGAHRLVLVALAVSALGQFGRALGADTTWLFVGTLLSLTGITAGNVLMPALIRMHFPDRVRALSAVAITVLMVGGVLGSGITLPLQRAVDGSWQTGLLVWAAVGVASLLPWVAASFRDRSAAVAPPRPSVRLRALLRSPLAWVLAGFFALQTAHVYVVLSWLGQVLLDEGIAEFEMGALLAVVPALGIVLSLTAPILTQRERRIPWLLLAFAVCYLVGYLGLLLAPAGGVWVWMSLIGLGGGTFPVVLTLIALRTRTPSGVVVLSAFVQSVGYLLGALGPLAFGLLRDLSGSWRASLILMIVLLIPMAALGRTLGRRRFLEDDLVAGDDNE